MMDLSIQIKTLLFSLLFGFVFNIFVTLLNKFIYNKKKVIQIVSTLILTLFSTITYFVILQKLNEAIIHPYFLLMFILGFSFSNVVKKLLKSLLWY